MNTRFPTNVSGLKISAMAVAVLTVGLGYTMKAPEASATPPSPPLDCSIYTSGGPPECSTGGHGRDGGRATGGNATGGDARGGDADARSGSYSGAGAAAGAVSGAHSGAGADARSENEIVNSNGGNSFEDGDVVVDARDETNVALTSGPTTLRTGDTNLDAGETTFAPTTNTNVLYEAPPINLGFSGTPTMIQVPVDSVYALAKQACFGSEQTHRGGSGSTGTFGLVLNFGDAGSEGLIDRLGKEGINYTETEIANQIEIRCSKAAVTALLQAQTNANLELYAGQAILDLELTAAQGVLVDSFNQSPASGCKRANDVIGQGRFSMFKQDFEFSCEGLSDSRVSIIERDFTTQPALCAVGTARAGQPIGEQTCDNAFEPQ